MIERYRLILMHEEIFENSDSYRNPREIQKPLIVDAYATDEYATVNVNAERKAILKHMFETMGSFVSTWLQDETEVREND